MQVEYAKSDEVIERLSLYKLYVPVYLYLAFIIASVLIIGLIVFFVVRSLRKVKVKCKRSNNSMCKKASIFGMGFIILLLALISLFCWDLSRHILDISNKSYIIYYGTYCKYSRDNIKLGNGERIIWKMTELDDYKTYEGYVIYSERTKKMLNYGNKNQAKKVKYYELNHDNGKTN